MTESNEEYSAREAMNNLFFKREVLLRERMFGLGWNSPGRDANIKDFLPKMTLRPGYSVLDVGCGTGGGTFYMAKYCGVNVHGVDISAASIQIAEERLSKEDKEVKEKIRFELADASQVDFKSNIYDVVYSSYAIFYVVDKERLYKKLYDSLKPGGKLIIGDLCLGPQDHCTKGLKEDVKIKLMNLLSINDYKNLIEGAGFKNVQINDETRTFIEHLEKDLKHFETTKEAFIKDFSREDYDSAVNFWTGRLGCARNGEFTAVVYQGTK